jgi:hypothetical protein
MRSAYLLMSQTLDIHAAAEYQRSPSRPYIRLPIAVFHTFEAACERLEQDSKLLSPDDWLRQPHTAEELKQFGSEGALKGYHCPSPTASSGERDSRGLYVIKVELEDDCGRKVSGGKEEARDVEGEEFWRSG